MIRDVAKYLYIQKMKMKHVPSREKYIDGSEQSRQME